MTVNRRWARVQDGWRTSWLVGRVSRLVCWSAWCRGSGKSACCYAGLRAGKTACKRGGLMATVDVLATRG